MEGEHLPPTIKSFFPRLSLRLVIAGMFFMASLCLFAFLIHEIFTEKEDLFDTTIIRFFASYHSPGLIKTMQVFTFFGSSYFLLPAYLVLVIWFLVKRHKGYSINIALMGVGSTLMVYILKLFFHRHRPEVSLVHLDTYSFPSGHTVSSFIFCTLLAWLVWRSSFAPVVKWLSYLLLFLITFTIGISRIILGAHYPSDVAAGLCLGAAWAIGAWWFVTREQHLSK
jgi:membrane-associated phospholipid phosphatase